MSSMYNILVSCEQNFRLKPLATFLLSSTLQNTERGRKINAAVVQTGKYVVQTGRAVGKDKVESKG